jgi:3-dehydroquinate dehydratase
MGAEGTKTRTILPSLGASLTYGHIDGISAPGQLRADELVNFLQLNNPEYDQSRIRRKKL